MLVWTVTVRFLLLPSAPPCVKVAALVCSVGGWTAVNPAPCSERTQAATAAGKDGGSPQHRGGTYFYYYYYYIAF